MIPTQVQVRFPAEVCRAWTFTPVGAVPRAGAIRPRRFAFAPDAAEAADGTFVVALLATDTSGSSWAWQVRDPDNRRRTVTVPSGAEAVDYADLPGEGEPPPESASQPTAIPTTGFDDAPAWMLDALRDMARRLALLEARDGTPAGEAPIDPDNPDGYLAGFINDRIGDYL